MSWAALALATAAAAAAGYLVELPEPPDAIAIDRATYVAQTRSSQQITLPHVSTFPIREQIGTARYSVHFDLPKRPDAPLYVYVPATNRPASLALNGEPISDGGNRTFLAGPLVSTSVLASLPQARLAVGRNELTLAFETGGALPRHLSKIYIGTEANLLPTARLRGFFQERLVSMALGAQILLGISIVFAYFCRPADPLFSWLAAVVVVSLVVAIGLFVDVRPGVQYVRIYAAALAPAVGFLFIGIAFALIGRRPPNALRIVAVTIPGLLAFVLLAGLAGSATVVALAGSILVCAFIVATGIVAWGALQRGNVEARLMLSPFFLFSWFAVRDMGVTVGLVEGTVLLSPYVRPLVLAAVMAVLMWRLAASLHQLDHANENLNRKLAEREAELAALHRQERLEAARAVREHERQRLTHDLHDGISGHLVSIIAMAERVGTEVKPIEEAARRALDDLRLVIYSLDLGDRELPLALANFRERLIPQLQRAGIELDWSTAGLPDVSGVTPGNALTILRILQEAITNALKHGPARRIVIRGGAVDGNRAAITVENDGRPFVAGHGNGLANMRRRAQQLHGHVEIEALERGTRLTLALPAALPDIQDEAPA
jgi:two-component system, NarL family, sensor histidine kinase UhpB